MRHNEDSPGVSGDKLEVVGLYVTVDRGERSHHARVVHHKEAIDLHVTAVIRKAARHNLMVVAVKI